MQYAKIERNKITIISKKKEQGEEVSFEIDGREMKIKITHSPKGQHNRVWQTMSIKLNENSKGKLKEFLNKK